MPLKAANEVEFKKHKTDGELANKTLFLDGLPSDCEEGMLIKCFSGMDGFERVRYIGLRNVAFVDFKNVADATRALEACSQLTIHDEVINATYAKR